MSRRSSHLRRRQKCDWPDYTPASICRRRLPPDFPWNSRC